MKQTKRIPFLKRLESLTPQERVTYAHLLNMLSYQEMASQMSVDLKTIKFHVGNVYRKLNIGNCRENTKSKRLVLLRKCLNFKPKKGFDPSNLEGLVA